MRSLWYQTTETLPGSPPMAHGHTARCPAGAAMSTGADHVCPKSFDTAILIWLGRGAGSPPQPVLLFLSRVLVSHTRYALSALSSITTGKCPWTVVFVTKCGVNLVSPRFHVPTPMPLIVPSFQ